MDYIQIVACLFALIGAVPALTLLSPIRVAQRAIPLLMIILSIVLWFLPTGLGVAMALVPVAAWISSRLGIGHAGHEPTNIQPAVARAKGAARKVRERFEKPKPLTKFVAKAYPGPGEPGTAELADAAAAPIADDGATEPEPSAAETMRDRLEQITRDPSLPAGASARLLGQRAGRDIQPSIRSGLRNGATRSFVPSLLG